MPRRKNARQSADRLRDMRLLPQLLVVLCSGLSACIWPKANEPVLITSDPPGARIWLDGHDTGQTTPHMFDIAGNYGSDHELELRRDGYRPERRHLYQHTEFYMSRWIDGAGPPGVPPLPFWWTAGDFFFPFGIRGAIVPGEVFIKMYRVDEPLLGFDVLAAREQATTTPGGGK
jgi:hypothetical protein